MTKLDQRIKAEKSITKALAKECFSFGGLSSTKIYVNYGNFEESVCCDNPSQVWKAANEVDECWLIVKNQYTGKTLGCFFLVYGNDGFDCIADMSVNEFTDKIDKALQPLIEKWEDKLL
jgi:hypothetical protein